MPRPRRTPSEPQRSPPVLRAHLDDTDGSGLDVDEYADEVAPELDPDPRWWSEVDQAVYVVANRPT